ncbi:hypothetical protein Dimus_035951 [Dionaea muscipula]
MNRWSSLRVHLNKYSACMRRAERSRASGTNIEDVIGVAKQFYFQTEGHNFKWEGCWRILKDSSKWFDYTREQEEKKKQKIAQRKGATDEIGATSTFSPISTTSDSINLDEDDSPFNKGPQELPRHHQTYSINAP